MGSDSVSTLILFIAAMLVAAGVAGTLVANVNDISNSIDTYSGDVKDQIDTDIEIISDPGSDAVYNASGENNISILVKNTGQKTLASDGTGLDILVNGEYVSSESYSLEVHDGTDGSAAWRSGNVAEIQIDQLLDAGEEHRVVVIANGDRETFDFYVA